MTARTWGVHEWLCLAAVLLGLFLRFHRLDEPLWYDEAVSVASASAPLRELPARLAGGEDSNPPAFPLLLKAWMRVAGGSDSAIHALTAAIGSLCVLSAGGTAAALFGPQAGFTAAAVMALHPWGVAYAQEARAYELLVLLGLWSCFFLARAMRACARRDWVAFGAASVLNLYTHNYAAFLLLGQAAWIALEARRRPAFLRPAVFAALGIAAGYAPWAVWAVRQARVLPALPAVGWHDVLFSLYSAAGLWLMAGPLVCHWPPGLLFPLLLADLGAAWLAWRALRREGPDQTPGLGLTALLAAAVPLALSLARPIYTTGRHTIVALPALCLLAAAGLEALKPRSLRLGVLGFLLGTWLWPVYAYFSAPKSFERPIAAFLQAHDGPGYRIVVQPVYRRLSLGRYYAPALQAQEEVPVASTAELPPGLMVVVEFPRELDRAQREMLARFYSLQDRRLFGSSEVAVLVRREPDR